MTIDDELEAIRRHRSAPPDSHAAAYLGARGLQDDALSLIQQLEIYTRTLVAAFDGELDDRNTSWMPYLEEKAERAEWAASRLAKLVSTAREMPPEP